MRSLVMHGLLILTLSLNCMAAAPVKIDGEYGQDALSMIANDPITLNAQDRSDLWSWGGSPVGYGQLFLDQSDEYGGWSPFDETPFSNALNETSSGYTINETRQIFPSQGQSVNNEDVFTSGGYLADDTSDEPIRLFPSQGFHSGYGDWEPSI